MNRLIPSVAGKTKSAIAQFKNSEISAFKPQMHGESLNAYTYLYHLAYV
ncbi:MAG: hypothetical protein KME22_02650 [Hassallia sp. WJT32-NPBG1]|nr:hypothetical protein [Hassallia sp. WJT32-NPBG1]